MKNKVLIITKWLAFYSIIISLLIQLTPFFENRKSADDVYETFQKMRDNPDVLIFGTSRV